MLDPFPVPGVNDMHQAVTGLDDRRVGKRLLTLIDPVNVPLETPGFTFILGQGGSGREGGQLSYFGLAAGTSFSDAITNGKISEVEMALEARRVGTEAEAGHHAGSVVLDEDVGVLDQLQQDLGALGRGQNEPGQRAGKGRTTPGKGHRSPS